MAKFSQICADLIQMDVCHAKILTLSTLGLLACEGPGITVERIDIRSERLSTETADGAIAVSLETELDSEFTNSSSIPVGVVFSAPVVGFDASDLDVTGGSVHDFAGEGELYSFSLVLEDDGEVVLRLPANAVQSEDGRSNSAAEPLVFVFDSTPPSVSLTTGLAKLTNVSPIPVTITFSEEVSGFDAGGISVTNGTTSDFSGSGSSYTVNVTPSAQGVVSVDVAAGVASDPSSNANTAATQYSLTYDSLPPDSAQISFDAGYTNTTSVTLNLSAGGATGMYVTNTAGCGAGGDWQTYATSRTWTLEQTNAIATVYAKFRDAIGNETSCVSDTIVHDDVSPQTPVIADASKFFNASFLTSIQQNPVSDPSFKEFRYTLDGTNPTCSTGMFSTSEPASVTIPAATTTLKVIACDEVGLFSPVAAAEYVFDNIKPSVTVTTEVSSLTNESPIPVTITFSEEVSGFDAGGISVTNGTTSDFAGSGSSYTVNVTPSAQGAVWIDVAAGVASDPSSNANVASESLGISYDAVAPEFTSLNILTPSPSTELNPTVEIEVDTAPVLVELYSDSGCSSSISDWKWIVFGTTIQISTSSLNENVVTDIYTKGRDDHYNHTDCELVGSYAHDNVSPQTPVIADASKSFNASFSTSIQQNPVSDPSFKEFRYTLDGTNPTCSTGTATAIEPASVTIPAATTTLKVIVCDEVGLFSPVAAAEYVYDTQAPVITNLNIQTSSPSAELKPTVGFTLDETATVTLYSDAGCSSAISAAVSKASGAQTMATSALPSDSVTSIYIRGGDALGQLSSCSLVGTYYTTLPSGYYAVDVVCSEIGQRFELSLPATSPNPQIVGAIRDPVKLRGAHRSVKVGSFVYTATYEGSHLVVSDFSDPQNPVLVYDYSDGTESGSQWVENVGNYIYLLHWATGNIAVFDITNRQSPSFIRKYVAANSGQQHWQLEYDAERGVLYSAGSTWNGTQNYLNAISIADPENPTHLSHLNLNGSIMVPRAVLLANDTLYITNESLSSDGTLLTVDASDPANLSILDSLTTTNLNNAAGSVFVKNDVAVVSSRVTDSLVNFDVSDPSQLSETGQYINGTELNGVAMMQVVGNFVISANTVNDSIAVLDISDLSAVEFVASVKDSSELDEVVGVFVDKGLVYATSWGNTTGGRGVVVIDGIFERNIHLSKSCTSLGATTLSFYWGSDSVPPEGRFELRSISAKNVSSDVSLVSVRSLQTNSWSDVAVGSEKTYRDNRTGLWWSNDRGSMPWQSGIDHCANLSYNGRDNWRMPNISELETGYNNNGFRYNSGLIPVSSGYVWSSSTHSYIASIAWYVDLNNGNTYDGNKYWSESVLCVSP